MAAGFLMLGLTDLDYYVNLVGMEVKDIHRRKWDR